ncbi:hypothetical protein T484DRAFT_3436951 [Baffinella frigidus]|nr:hypothetical protein T484DRAFT_3436951 [Cryptophyta sp. CCMP2293]
MRTTCKVYLGALSLFIAGASIAPPHPSSLLEERSLYFCSSLADRLPCDQAEGTWRHMCRAAVSVTCAQVMGAVELSRRLPEHVLDFASPPELRTSSTEFAGRIAVRLVGTFLGLALLLLGRLLYRPFLFYLPALLVGCSSMVPLQPLLEERLGFSLITTSAIGAIAGVIFAHVQRHVFVWLFGLLMGLLAFITCLVGTTALHGLPTQAVVVAGGLAGLCGASLMKYLERTLVWQVVACASVGAVLLTVSDCQQSAALVA